MAEYNFIPEQIVLVDENILFLNGDRCCKKGYRTRDKGDDDSDYEYQ